MSGTGPVHYEVTATVRPDLVDQWLRWLEPGHVGAVLATGCFVAASVEREDDGRVRVRYTAPDRAALDRYLAVHAARLRADGLRAFAEGVTLERSVWQAAHRAS